MDERQLTAFVLLAEELNFSRAAARLGLTQPALSLMIARLEAELAVRLFERTKRRVALTGPGRVFLAETEQSLRQLDLSRAMARRAAEGKAGRIAIGFVEAAPFSVLPGIVARIRASLPDLEIVLREMVTSEQIEALDAGRIDLGLMRPMFSRDRFESLSIHREPYVVAVSTASPLAARGALRYADLAGERLITTPLPKRRYAESRFRAVLTAEGLALPIAHEIHQIHAVVGLVAGNLGIAFVPASASVIAQPGVRYLPFREPRPPFSEMVAAWRRDEASMAVRRVAGLLAAGGAGPPGQAVS